MIFKIIRTVLLFIVSIIVFIVSSVYKFNQAKVSHAKYGIVILIHFYETLISISKEVYGTINHLLYSN